MHVLFIKTSLILMISCSSGITKMLLILDNQYEILKVSSYGYQSPFLSPGYMASIYLKENPLEEGIAEIIASTQIRYGTVIYYMVLI